MLRRDAEAVAERSSLSTAVFRSDEGQVTIKELVFVCATCMTPGVVGDKNAAYLVRLADKRHLLKMSTVGSGTAGEGQYNVRYGAPPDAEDEDLYYEESLKVSGEDRILWTWQTMLDDLWGKLPSGIAGSAPTLPYEPGGNPEGFRFLGVSAWDAINAVLLKLSCAVAFDPTSGELSYVKLGTDQAGYVAGITQLQQHRILDWDPIESAAADIPETIRVFFHRKDEHFGCTLDAQRTGGSSMQPCFSVDEATGIAGARAGTVLPLWDDLPAVYDIDGTLTNETALNDRAAEVAANYKSKLRKSDERLRLMYSGIRTELLPGSQIKEVIWRDYGDGVGVVTEVLRYAGPEPNGSVVLPGVAERLLPPDLGRVTEQRFPTIVFGVLDESLNEGGTATVSIYRHDGDDWIDTGLDVDAIDGILTEGQSFESGARVILLRDDDAWKVMGLAGGGSSALRWRNVDTETAPAYAVLEVCGGGEDEGGIYVECRRPSQDDAETGYTMSRRRGASFYFNLGTEVAVYDEEDEEPAVGLCTQNFPARAAYDDADTPAYSQVWGPVAGSWLLNEGRAGFMILGGIEAADGDVPDSVIVTRVTHTRHCGVTTTLNQITLAGVSETHHVPVIIPAGLNRSDFNFISAEGAFECLTDGYYDIQGAVSVREIETIPGSPDPTYEAHNTLRSISLYIIRLGAGNTDWQDGGEIEVAARMEGTLWGAAIAFNLDDDSTLEVSNLYTHITVKRIMEIKAGDKIRLGLNGPTSEDPWKLEGYGYFTAISVD